MIAGGGPTGGLLAAELALAKVDVAFAERRPDHARVGLRACGLRSRTIEELDHRGVADRFLGEGHVAQTAMFALTVADMSDFPTRHPYRLEIWRYRIGRITAAWIAELPVRIDDGCEATGSPNRASTELKTLANRPATVVRRGPTAPEVSR